MHPVVTQRRSDFITVACGVIAVALLAGSPADAARLYKWTDANGQVQYGDTPPAGAQNVEEKEIRGASTENEKNSSSQTGDVSLVEIAEKTPITLYTVPHCESCDLMRLFLQRNQLPFTEYDVKGDTNAQARLMDAAGELRLPFMTVGKESLDVYSRSSMRNLLTRQGYPLQQEVQQEAK